MLVDGQRGEVLAADSLNDFRMIRMLGPYLKFRRENIFKTQITIN